MRIDGWYDWALPIGDKILFDIHARKYIERYKFQELKDATSQLFYLAMVDLIRAMEQPEPYTPHRDTSVYRIRLTTTGVIAVNRFAKIAQIEIGEENEDQKVFQTIAQEFHLII